MKRAALHSVVWACLSLGVNSLPLNVATGRQEQQRTALPWLLLLAYPQALQQSVGILPGIPIRRPQDELTVTQKPTQISADVSQSVQNDENVDANALIREQFIQGIVQGLQAMAANGGPTIQPAVLAGILEQANAVQNTKAPGITPPTIETEAPSNDDNNTEADYDYIDFKNGSRIKYELENDQQPTDVHYPNKILQSSIQQTVTAPQQYVI